MSQCNHWECEKEVLQDEIKRLNAVCDNYNAINERVRADTIERCAQEVERFISENPYTLTRQIVAAIRSVADDK